MKILVTGGAGFIGSHIVDTYIAAGHRVAVIDNMSHGFKKNLNPKAVFYKSDIRDLNRMRQIIKKERPQVINHHAAIAEVVRSMTEPLPTMQVNVEGTINVLLAGGEVGIKKFLFASTGGAIYGETARYPITETVTPRPPSPYGLSKLLAEHCIAYYAGVFGFHYLIFRYPNVFGERQDPHGEAGVVAIFTKQLQAGARPTIFGDGTKTRDYIYVRDIARANVIGLRRGKNDIVNLGRGKEISDQAVYDAVQQHTGSQARPKYVAVRAGEVLRSSLNAARAQHVLGWKPQYTFSDGVARTVRIMAAAK